MDKLIRIGIDTSKSVFQLHGVNAKEEPVLRKQLRRSQLVAWFARLEPTKIGLEACGGSHHLARLLKGLGHEAVLIPPQYSKVYVARGKNDAADAEAVCEAMSRPKVQKRFVPVKTVDQQAAQMLVQTRDRFIRRRTQLSNTIRGYAAEFGLVAPRGLAHLATLMRRIDEDAQVPQMAKELFRLHTEEYAQVELRLRRLEAMLMTFHKENEVSQRLARIPTLGPIGAAMLAAKVTDAKSFKSGRDFAAWIGLTPKDHSTAGKHRSGGITRAGDEALRSTTVLGATALIQQIKRGKARHASPWLIDLLKRKPVKLVAVALANKTARIAWKLMVSGESYNANKAEGRKRALADAGKLRAAA
jgi:transposase